MKVGTLLLSVAACTGGRAAAQSLCVLAAGNGLSSLASLISDESALEVCIHDDAPYKSTFVTFNTRKSSQKLNVQRRPPQWVT